MQPLLGSWTFRTTTVRSLDALNDCLRDIASRMYGTPHDSSGTALVLRHFDHFAKTHASVAQALLDIWAGRAWDGLLIGHLMMCLVQSDDREITFQPVGPRPVGWNAKEWPKSKRGL
jgi:hypothetical protein